MMRELIARAIWQKSGLIDADEATEQAQAVLDTIREAGFVIVRSPTRDENGNLVPTAGTAVRVDRASQD